MSEKILDDLRIELARVEPEAASLQEQARELAEKAKSASDTVTRLKGAIAALDGKAEPANPLDAIQPPHGTVPFIPAAPYVAPWFPRWLGDHDPRMPWYTREVTCLDSGVPASDITTTTGFLLRNPGCSEVVIGGDCIPGQLRDTLYAS